MLGPGRYLLGVAELTVLVGCAWLGASALRSRLLPRLAGAPAQLAAAVLALALLLWVAEFLGTFGLLEAVPYLFGIVIAGLLLRFGPTRPGPPPAGGAVAGVPRGAEGAQRPSTGGDAAATGPAVEGLGPAAVIAWAIAVIALIH